MSSATETCSCGAKIEISNASGDARLRQALAEWRTTHRHGEPAVTATKTEEPAPEHVPNGNNFASTERRGTFYEPDELNSQFRPGPYGRGISLKWRATE